MNTSTSCEHPDELIALGAMRLLSAEEEAQLTEQVRQCPACRVRQAEYRALAQAMPWLITLESARAQLQSEQQPTPGSIGQKPLASRRTSPATDRRDAGGTAPSPAGLGIIRPLRPNSLQASHRLVSALSGLAAVLVLTVLVGGFWLLAYGRGHGSVQPAKQGCTSQASTATGPGWACGLLAVDYTIASGAVVALDSHTGKPLPGLAPLPAGNATLSATSANHHTLALVVAPYGISAANYLQIVALDHWQLGPQLPDDLTIEALAISDDGTHIYTVTAPVPSNTGPAGVRLQSYRYQPGQKASLQLGWSADIPFAPDWGAFAVSPDDSTLYAFTAQTTPAQVMEIKLRADGIETPQIHALNFANGVEPPFNENLTVNPNDKPLEVFHPAVIFSADRSKLYLIYAPPAPDSGHDRLLIINLLNWRFNTERDITESGLALSLPDPSGAANEAAHGPLLATHPATTTLSASPASALRPAKGVPFNGRDEWGVVSPDGRWLYLTGVAYTGTPHQDGTWDEKTSYLGLWKVNVQTGQIVKHWFQGTAFYDMHLSPDGETLYLFDQPANAEKLVQKPATVLALSTKTDSVGYSFDLKDNEQIILAP